MCAIMIIIFPKINMFEQMTPSSKGNPDEVPLPPEYVAQLSKDPLVEKHKSTILGYKEDVMKAKGEVVDFPGSIAGVAGETLSSFTPKEFISTKPEDIADVLVAANWIYEDERAEWLADGKGKGGQLIKDYVIVNGDKTIRVKDLVIFDSDKKIGLGSVEIEKVGADKKRNVFQMTFDTGGPSVSYNGNVLAAPADFPSGQFDKTLTLKILDILSSYPQDVEKASAVKEARRKLEELKKEDPQLQKIKSSGVRDF